MYLSVNIAGINTTALNDSGASMRFISYTCCIKLKDLPLLRSIHALTVHSVMGHDLCHMDFIHCTVMVGNTQFMNTFIACKHMQENVITGLDIQQLHHFG